jgi:hypothetical protein
MLSPRFRTRTLILAIVVVALVLGGLRWAMRPYPTALVLVNDQGGPAWCIFWTDHSRPLVPLADAKTPIPRSWDKSRWFVTVTWSDGSRSYYWRQEFVMKSQRLGGAGGGRSAGEIGAGASAAFVETVCYNKIPKDHQPAIS